MKRISSLIIAFILLSAAAGGVFAYSLPANESLKITFPYSGLAYAALCDAKSGAFISEHDSARQAKPGSLTVLMTALLLTEATPDEEWNTPLDPLKKVNSTWSARAAQMGLKEDDTPTRRDLIYGLLLTGAADAAYVTEQTVSGSTQAFVEAMNTRAAELGLTGTKFENSYGLSSGVHYTTAHDMALLALECLKHEVFREAVRSADYVCSSGVRETVLVNTNTSLGEDGCIGLKTGFDSGMEYSAVLLYEQGELELISVILEAGSAQDAATYAASLAYAGFAGYMQGPSGLSPMTPTAALARAGSDLTLNNGVTQYSLKAGEPITLCAYYNDTAFVYANDEYYRTPRNSLTQACMLNDIVIEHGDALTREHVKGEAIELDAAVYTRHEILSVKTVLTLPDGSTAFMGEYLPHTHGAAELKDTELAERLRSAQLSEGIYDCAITVTAEADAPDGSKYTLIRESHSTLSVGTGAECVSYNANGGDGAPAGECYLGSFTVPEETPSKMGSVFAGWNTQKDGSGRVIKPGETVEGSVTNVLYAMWEEGEYAWDTQARFGFENSFTAEGFIRNDAGITQVRLHAESKNGNEFELVSDCAANEAALGELLISAPVTPEPGEYTVELYASAGGRAEELLISQTVTVGKAAPTEEQLPEPTEGEPKEGFSLSQVPIAVWFAVGAVVVAGLIAAIVHILKNG